MKVIEITWRNRNDYNAIVECEHCAGTQPLRGAYADEFYAYRVLPKIHCAKCGKDRAGEVAKEQVSA